MIADVGSKVIVDVGSKGRRALMVNERRLLQCIIIGSEGKGCDGQRRETLLEN